MRMNRVICLAAAAFVLVGCTKPKPPPEQAQTVALTVVNGKVWTGDSQHPWAEAVAIDAGKILAVGTNAEVAAIGLAERTIDARGKLVVPGFIDSHVHFVDAGLQLASVQLRDARTKQELIARVKAFAATLPSGTWLTGGGWDSSHWGGELPTREWLDAVTGDRPAWLSRVDGHMSLANTAALKAAGVDRNTPDVAGGEIVRDKNGNPTGALKENAMSLVDRVVPPASAQLRDRALTEASKYVNAQGVTSVHSMGTFDDIETFTRAAKKGSLSTRVYAVAPLPEWATLRDAMQNGLRSDEWVRIGGLKGFVDGSLGSHTAAMFEPFKDSPADRGLLVNTPEQLYSWISEADKAGLHVMVHAIGDRAISTLLDIYERVGKENGARDRRFRIEHVQHLAPQDITRFAQLAVIASMQPYHAIDDGRWAERYIGDRIATTYAFRDLIDQGARVAFGSDWFVAPPTPLEGIYAAVTRRTLDEKNPDGWVPKQKITVEEALRAYTSNAAYAAFDEQVKGVLVPGFAADLAIIDRDLFTIPPAQLRDAKVDLTVVGGKVVYERAAQ
jgi:predicted amidohydrolase YtcJ